MKKGHACERCHRHKSQLRELRTKTGRLRVYCLKCYDEVIAKGVKPP